MYLKSGSERLSVTLALQVDKTLLQKLVVWDGVELQLRNIRQHPHHLRRQPLQNLQTLNKERNCSNAPVQME